jgi:hypothetical protein
MTAGAVVVIAGSLSPWVASGAAQRTSYEVFDLIDRLGFARSGAFGIAIRAWPFVPLLVVAATIAAWWTRWRAAAALGTAGGIYALAVSATIRRAPGSGLVTVLDGPTITLLGAALLLSGCVIALTLAVRPGAGAATR